MLKVKDNIDLKELEKFGFKQGQDMCDVSYSAYGKVFEVEYSEKISDMLIDIVEIDKKNKKIELLRSSKNSCRSYINNDEEQLEKYIDDLIKAYLVVKVDNNE